MDAGVIVRDISGKEKTASECGNGCGMVRVKLFHIFGTS